MLQDGNQENRGVKLGRYGETMAVGREGQAGKLALAASLQIAQPHSTPLTSIIMLAFDSLSVRLDCQLSSSTSLLLLTTSFTL